MTKRQAQRVLGGMVTIFGFVGVLSVAGAYEIDNIGFLESILFLTVCSSIMFGGGVMVVKS